MGDQWITSTTLHVRLRNFSSNRCVVFLSLSLSGYPIKRWILLKHGISGARNINQRLMSMILILHPMLVFGISMFMHVLLVDLCNTVVLGNCSFGIENFRHNFIWRIPPSGEIYHSTVIVGPADRGKLTIARSENSSKNDLDSLWKYGDYPCVWSGGNHCSF